MKENRIGERIINTQGQIMEIIKYESARCLDVKFEDGTIVKNKAYGEFRKGGISNPNYKSMYGIGYIGIGEYSSTKHKKHYETWKNMFTRCYSEKYHETRPTYKECTVCPEWHCFQNFARWYDENFYNVNNERMSLDKDILVKGNKVYSPETCIFLPSVINSSFEIKKKNKDNLPTGIRRKKWGYELQCNNTYIGIYKTLEEAINEYFRFKEKSILDTANKYKDYLPEKVYQAIISWVGRIRTDKNEISMY